MLDWFKLAKQISNLVVHEINQIERLFTVYADLLRRVQQREPDEVEIAAVASVLHSFYNGLENIFRVVAKNIDESVPSGAQSHQALLTQISQRTGNRSEVISRESAKKLKGYLSFRHFYRHSYSFFIEWQELSKLVYPLRGVWLQAKTELQDFVNSLTVPRDE
jgi:hypothetical protein